MVMVRRACNQFQHLGLGGCPQHCGMHNGSFFKSANSITYAHLTIP